MQPHQLWSKTSPQTFAIIFWINYFKTISRPYINMINCQISVKIIFISLSKQINLQNKYQFKTKAMLEKILSAAAVILGIYIITIHVLIRAPDANQVQGYHIGCFLIDSHMNNASHQINAELQEIQQEVNSIIKVGLHNSKVMGEDFDYKAMQLSKKFDLYIDALIANKLKQNSEIQFFRALRQSSKDFDDCRKGMTLNETECKDNWFVFKGCQGRLQNLKGNLNSLLSRKQNVLDKVNSLLDYNYQSDFKKNKTNQVDIKYQTLMVQIQAKQREQQEKLTTLKQILQSENYYLSTLKNDLGHIRDSYYDCQHHRQQYRHCQEITNEVQLLGYGSIETLQKRIDQKGNTLSQLKLMLDKSDNSASYASLENIWKKGIQQYKGLLKLFIETKAKINLKCGCSEQKEIQLQKEYEKVKILVHNKNAEILSIETQIKQANAKIESLGQEKDNLWSTYQKEVSDLANTGINKIDTQGILLKNKIELEKIHSEIQGTQRNINSLEFECNQYKNSMSKRLIDINNANTCLYKKQYYVNMKRLGSMNSKAKESDDQKAIRNELREFLSSYGEIVSITTTNKKVAEQKVEDQRVAQEQKNIENVVTEVEETEL